MINLDKFFTEEKKQEVQELTVSSGSLLDARLAIPSIGRYRYKGDIDNKPNDYCYWDNTPFGDGVVGWVENDAHLRERRKMLVSSTPNKSDKGE